MIRGNAGHQQESWLVSIAKGVGICIAVCGGISGLCTIMISVGAEPRPPGSSLIDERVIVRAGVGILIALLAAAGLICAFGRGQRSTRVRLGGLLAVDMIFVIGVVLFRVFAT
ncbi:hypothetical protein [Actinoallomurus sp. CA-150999]|uniref:hypothetical protein n=1 Tax=Actinoallomurus sp. CA-150999 TaxID=3239887 RepID=UPI003D93393A